MSGGFSVTGLDRGNKYRFGARLYERQSGKHDAKRRPEIGRIAFVQEQHCPYDAEKRDKVADLNSEHSTGPSDQPDI